MSNKSEIYERIFFSKIEGIGLKDSYTRDNWKQLTFYGIRFFNFLDSEKKSASLEEAQARFELLEIVSSFTGMLMPNEFTNIFPVTKKYDGYKWEMKDYYSTMEHINTLDRDKPIMEQEEPLQFLYEYDNEDVFKFSVASMMVISNLCKFQGQKTPLEILCEENNITTYSKFDSCGKEYLKNNQTGKVIKITKPLPKHMRIIK